MASTTKKSTDQSKTESTKHLVEETPRGQNGSPGGRIQMSENVVATIAGLAARGIEGIHSLGKSRLIRLGDDPTRGVAAEVGEKQAALDLEVIIEHGCDIRDVAKQMRQRIAEEVNRMTGRTVVEVNLDVVGINTETEPTPAPEQQARVV